VLISDVVEFCGGHAVNNGIERHVWAFLHEKKTDAVHLLPGLDNSVGEGGEM